jgi:DNA-binding SARP family transcriptional activator
VLPRHGGFAPVAADPRRPAQGLWIAALGPLEARRDGVPLSLGPPARRAVLGLLLMNPSVLVRRDAIVDTLWGDAPPRTAVGLVQAHVSRLRKALTPRDQPAHRDGLISLAGKGYILHCFENEMDLLVFRDLVARAAIAQSSGDDAIACDLYERAVDLWRGDPLADVDLLYGHPGITLLRQELVSVLLRYADVACALGQYHRVLPQLRALVAAEPLNEPAHVRLMITLADSGEQAAAIRVYEDLRLRLDRELGLYPGEALAEAHMRVLRRSRDRH